MCRKAYWEVSSKVGNYLDTGFMWEIGIHSIEHNFSMLPIYRFIKVTKTGSEHSRIAPISFCRVIYVATFTVKLDHRLLCIQESEEIIKSVEKYFEKFLKAHKLKFAWIRKGKPERYYRCLGRLGLHSPRRYRLNGVCWLLENEDTLEIQIISKTYLEHNKRWLEYERMRRQFLMELLSSIWK